MIQGVSQSPFLQLLQSGGKQATQPPQPAAFAGMLGSAAASSTTSTTPAQLGFQSNQFPSDAWGDPSLYSPEPAAGAGKSYLDMCLWYGRGAIESQAEQNQIGNQFAAMTGANPANFTAQLPDTPAPENQNQYDLLLAYENMQRLDKGETLVATDYWNAPPAMTSHVTGKTYTAAQLGWTGTDAASASDAPAPQVEAAPAVETAPVVKTAPATGIRPILAAPTPVTAKQHQAGAVRQTLLAARNQPGNTLARLKYGRTAELAQAVAPAKSRTVTGNSAAGGAHPVRYRSS